MSKIRINELARELEVTPIVILELLPELGVKDKKTHSSSLDDEVVLNLRRCVTGTGAPDEDEKQEPVIAQQESTGSHATAVSETAPVAKSQPVSAEPEIAKSPVVLRPESSEPPAPVRPAFPLRPPLATGQTAAPSAPAVRGVVIPSRPAPPPPKPGQLLSGPRQPMPPTTADAPRPAPGMSTLPLSAASPSPPTIITTPGSPRPGTVVPTIPTPPRAPARPSPGAAAPPAAQTLGGTIAGGGPLRPPAKPNLVGQPAARPVVPPRADIVARLARPTAMPSAPAPGAPRPGMPTARPASPVPGRPIYTGPVRPGQPLMRGPSGPGGPRLGGPSGPMRGRPMHPTSPLRAEPASMPADPGRRHATKPGVRGADRRREDEEGRIRPVMRRQESFQPPPIDREITIAEGITVKELSEKLGIKGNLLVKRLVEKKIFATINQTMDVKLAEELSRDFGASTNKVSYEEESTHEIQQTEVDEDRERRPPVVTIMGHVDHGKTSLLDAIRSANVAAKEAGGITQHIGAYHVEKNGKNIVFIDTPGHEAFTRMRARGAKVTDIVILVVAADDGVMPQTLEAIDHAKAAGVPIIVAINKIDRPDSQPDRIKQQLSDRGLLAEDWAGETVMVPVSAKAKQNLDLLLEMILLVADMQDLKANPARPAMGTVLEAKLDRGRGPVATVLVRNGTLKVGDYFICGSVFGRVRAMFDDHLQPVREILPSMPG